MTTSATPQQLVFVVDDITDWQTVLTDIPADAQVHLLDAQGDALAQMVAILTGQYAPGSIEAIHVVSHGSAGAVRLGSLTLDDATLRDRAGDLAALGSALSADGDILLYGCNVAAGENGIAFVNRLARLTGADVAASEDVTGLGGDWVLEVASGAVETDVLAPTGFNTTLGTGDQALDFDGVDDYVSLASRDLYTGLTALTVEAWVYPTSGTGWHEVFYVAPNNITLALYGTSLYGFINDNADGDQPSMTIADAVSLNQWNHIAMTWDTSGTQILYANGVEVGKITNASTAALVAGTGGPYIGALASNAELFQGQIDELRVWRTVRTETELRQNMSQPIANPASEANLISYYSFDALSGTTLTDLAGSNTGTLTNMADADWVTSAAMFGPKNALSFDGANDYFTAPTNGYSNSTTYTVELWYKPTADKAGVHLWETGNQNSSPSLEGDSTSLNFWSSNANSINTGTLTVGEWHHLAAVYDKAAQTQSLYVNGKLVGE